MLDKLILGSLALLVIACGPSGSTGVSPAPDTGGAPKTGGVLNVPVTNDPTTWDMTISRSTPNSPGAAMAYDPLLTWKTGSDVDYNEGVLIPKLAERWEVSRDARSYTFHLRKGVKFADAPPLNSRELTSADVKWSYEYASRTGAFKDKNLPPAEFDFMFEGLDRIETPDRYTAVVHFKAPFAPFLNYSAADWNLVMPQELYAMEGNLQDNMLGTGPFQLDTAGSQKGTRWAWKKNPSYWEPGKPFLDQVRWIVIKEDATMYAAFQTKQVDLLETIGLGPAEEVKRATSASCPSSSRPDTR